MKDHVTHAADSGTHADAPTTEMNIEVRPAQAPEKPQPARGHRLMMLGMCLPMLVVVGVLVTTGVAGGGAVVYALLCTAMMAAMMILMPGSRH